MNLTRINLLKHLQIMWLNIFKPKKKDIKIGEMVYTHNKKAKDHCDHFGWRIIGSDSVKTWRGEIINPKNEVLPIETFLERTETILDGAGYSMSARTLVELRITARNFKEHAANYN